MHHNANIRGNGIYSSRTHRGKVLQSLHDLFNFRVALVENIERKNLSDPEETAAIKEYDEMKRRLEGSKDTRLAGKDNFGGYTVASDDGWTQDKTATDLGISRQAVTKAIKIAKAVEEIPELDTEKNRIESALSYWSDVDFSLYCTNTCAVVKILRPYSRTIVHFGSFVDGVVMDTT